MSACGAMQPGESFGYRVRQPHSSGHSTAPHHTFTQECRYGHKGYFCYVFRTHGVEPVSS